jgi:hypothetical protein
MSTHATDNGDESSADRVQERRYAELNIDENEFVIYDRENHQAWVQSTVAVSLEELC